MLYQATVLKAIISRCDECQKQKNLWEFWQPAMYLLHKYASGFWPVSEVSSKKVFFSISVKGLKPKHRRITQRLQKCHWYFAA